MDWNVFIYHCFLSDYDCFELKSGLDKFIGTAREVF